MKKAGLPVQQSVAAATGANQGLTFSAGIALLLSSLPNTKEREPTPAMLPLCSRCAVGCLPTKDPPRPSLLAPAPAGSDPSISPAGAKRDLGGSCGTCGSEALRASRLSTSCEPSSSGMLPGPSRSCKAGPR